MLAPLNVGDADVERIMGFGYKPGHELSVENADAIDASLAAMLSMRHVSVDRDRLAESMEAWCM